jgi:hypothetical protein
LKHQHQQYKYQPLLHRRRSQERNVIQHGNIHHQRISFNCHSHTFSHHCRKNHSSCDGVRPCSRCIRKKKQCFDYDPSLESRPRKLNGDVIAVSSTELSYLQNELTHAKEQVRTSTQTIQQLEAKISQLVHHIQQQEETYRLTVLNKPPSHNDVELDLWHPSSNPHVPLLIYDRTTLRMIGSNEAFRHLMGFDIHSLKDYPIVQLIAEQFRESWAAIVEWKLKGNVKSLSGCLLLKGKERDVCIRVHCHNESSFIWTNVEPSDNFDDKWEINDLVLPSTFSFPYSSSLSSLISTPAASLQRLMNALKVLAAQNNHNHQQQQQQQFKYEDASDNSVYNSPSTSPQQLLLESQVPQQQQPPIPQQQISYQQLLAPQQPLASQDKYIQQEPTVRHMYSNGSSTNQYQSLLSSPTSWNSSYYYSNNQYPVNTSRPEDSNNIQVNVHDILELLSNYPTTTTTTTSTTSNGYNSMNRNTNNLYLDQPLPTGDCGMPILTKTGTVLYPNSTAIDSSTSSRM